MKIASTAAALLAALMLASACTGFTHPTPGEVAPASATAVPAPVPPVAVSVDSVFTNRPVFGISLPDMTPQSLAAATTSAGCRPQVVNRFISVVTGVSMPTLKSAPGTPMLSLEPWRPASGRQQADFTLQKTVDGKWDAQYKLIAQTVIQYHDPVLIRFAHEMNGDWYPWGVGNNNTPAAYIAAWRHVVDIFRQFGATNVLWVWSPNILRGASTTTIKQFWPGPDYVDIVGMTGYGVRETDVALTFGPTLTLVEQLADKPLLLTETGAQADQSKTQWMSSFGTWLRAHPKVLGFVWFESNRGDDWRFDDTATNLTAFKKSLDTAKVSC